MSRPVGQRLQRSGPPVSIQSGGRSLDDGTNVCRFVRTSEESQRREELLGLGGKNLRIGSVAEPHQFRGGACRNE